MSLCSGARALLLHAYNVLARAQWRPWTGPATASTVGSVGGLIGSIG